MASPITTALAIRHAMCNEDAALKALLATGRVDKTNLEICNGAAASGSCAALAVAHEGGCVWDETTMYISIRHDNLECVQYCAVEGCPQCDEVLEIAAYSQSGRCLGYLLNETDADNRYNAMDTALREDNLSCVKILLACGYPCDELLFCHAAQHDCLTTLKYLHIVHNIFTKEALPVAVAHRNLDVIDYLSAPGT